MTRKLSKTIEFVSIHIVTAFMRMSEMADDECGRWVKKALTDMALGCSGNDVDPMVRSAYEDSLNLVEKSREAKKKYREKNKTKEKKPEQLIYGSFENVYLSQDEYNDLAQRFGNLNELNSAIENLSAKLEDGSQKSTNHYATLSYWAQYRDHKEDSQPKYVSAADRTMEVYKQGLEYIRAKYGNGQNENR